MSKFVLLTNLIGFAIIIGFLARPVQPTYAESPDPVEISVEETITVTDAVSAEPIEIITIPVEETITVTDAVSAEPIEVITIPVEETITVTDVVSAEPIEVITIPVEETITVTDDISAEPIEVITIPVGEIITVTDDVSAEPIDLETISQDFFGTVKEIESIEDITIGAQVKPPGSPSPFFGGSIDGSKILTILTNDDITVKVIANQSTVVENPYKPEGVQEIEIGWTLMVSANQPPPIGNDILPSAMATAMEISVIPDEPLGSHKLCTVVGTTDDGRTSLACNDGVQITVDDTGLPAGTNAVMLVHPEQPSKLISTAESLMDRMSRFQALMTGQDDLSKFDSLKDTVETGFFTAQEQAVNAAPDEVKELMTKLGNIQQRITDLAKAFTSGDPNVTVSSSDIDTLATMLAEFAASPEKLLDVMIDGYEDDVPSEEKQELKDLIYSKSVDHFSYLNISLLEIVALLKDGDLETALAQLEAVTASDEVWEQNVVMPIMNDFYGTLEEQYNEEYDESVKQLAEDVKAEIVMVQELLELDTDWIEPATKTQLEETLADLQTALTDDDPDAMYESLTAMVELMQSLPTEHEVSGGEEYGEGSEDDGSIQELVDAANAEILFAENMLEEYADSITETASQNIRDLISNLRQLLTGNDRDKIYSALTDLMDSLAFSEGDSESPDPTYVDIQCPPKFPVGHELNCSFKYDGLLEGHTWTAVFSVDNSKITSTEWLFVATYEQLGTVSLSLTACGKSKCIDATHSIEIAEPKTNGGETSPDDHTGEQGQSSADDHTSGEGQSSGEQGPSSSDGHSGEQGQPSSNGPSVDFSIEIECSPEIQVDQPIACSFKHSGAPDKITWSAPDGNPSTGSGNTFQTSFSTLGQASISLEACMESLCKTDTHTIMVIPKPEEVEPSQEENDQQDDSQY